MTAKIASALSKPDGLLEVPPAGVEEFLAPLAVSHIWGVGPVTLAALTEAGIQTIGQLARTDPDRLRIACGRQALALAALARGHDPRSVDPARIRKSYGEENTFAQDLRDGDELRRTVVAHAEAVAARLRADGFRARTVVLKLKLARRIGPGKYPLLTRSRTFAEATHDGRVIAAAALGLWQEIGANLRVRLIGVAAANLEESQAEQLSLSLRSGGDPHALNRALDRIAARFGSDAVRRGGLSIERAAPTLAIKDRRRSP